EGKEERLEGKKMYDYMNDGGEDGMFDRIKGGKVEFCCILERFKDSLGEEGDVTEGLYNV
ncbi:ferritin family protein, partial [Staphylococcus epidermidis]